MLWESILVSLAAAITTIQQAGGHPATTTLMANDMSRRNHFQLSINSTATVDSSPYSLSTSVTSHNKPVRGRHPRRVRRQSSSLSVTAMRMPGTNWCGKGWRAQKYYELGTHAAADSCCRQHDLTCQDYITAGETKDGLHNYRPYTAMHCSCDERFRTCLQMANTEFADTVGNVFFNVIRTKCFIYSNVDVCVERTWWRCNKYEQQRQAVFRDVIPYTNNRINRF